MGNNNYQHIMVDYFVDLLRQISDIRNEYLSTIENENEAECYQVMMKKAIKNAFSPRPTKTPLKPRITGTLQMQNYRIEKILFESRPDCLVSANLYIPNNLKKPAPGVIVPCGHSEDGKACALYQEACQRLVHSGFVVLVYDPFNQGERDQYALLSERNAVKSCCPAHNMMGKQLELIGEFFGMWRVWDGIRALDYLLTRREVDRSHIGLTGNSGGGTLTTWLWAVDDRFTMAAPGCFVTTFLNNLENEIPADCEQYPPGVIGYGMDMADFFIAQAPKPVILLGQKYDFFDRRGLEYAYEEIKYFYSVINAPKKNIALFIGPEGHGYSVHNQEAMVEFFCRHAKMKPVKVEKTEVLDEKELYATPDGNVIKIGSKPIFDLIAEKADKFAESRIKLDSSTLRKRLLKLLGIVNINFIPYYRVLRPTNIDGKTYARYSIETEPEPLMQSILKKRMDKPQYSNSLDIEETVHLYIPHLSSEEDLKNDPLAISLKNSHQLYSLDIRGFGESMPEGINDFLQPYGMDYMFHGHHILLGTSYVGHRVQDTLSTIKLLINEGAKEIHLYGRGQGAIIALFAGIIEKRLASVTIKNAPSSFDSWVHAPIVLWPSANFLKGVLKEFDLPDCVAILGDKLTVIEPWDPDMKPY
jgi:cephalosporin-C deacetylase-like acetyl esterase